VSPQLAATVSAAHDGVRTSAPGVVSGEAKSLVRNLLDAPVPARRRVLATLDQREMQYVLQETKRETGALYGLWHDAPSGFVEDVLGETVWSKQREVLDAVAVNKRVAVPAGFGLGKTHLAGRLTAWFIATRPIGIGLVVTTAPRYRQVRNQLWPHIRKAVAKGNLPGTCDTVQWKAPDEYGNDVLVAYGFSAPENDESAMQGIHAISLLLVVDEAGGMSKMVGEGTNNLLTGDARMLAIGNPATDDPGSWFEGLSEEGYAGETAGTVTIHMPSTSSPQLTGEVTGVCKECPAAADPHPLSKHLPDEDWVNRTIAGYGEDHPYVVAKVHARFPKDAGARIIPSTWVDLARAVEDPEGPDYVRPCDLDLEGEDETFTVKKGAWVRLGIDVAADGGDEFAIYRAVGDVVSQRHVSSGSANSNSVAVATVALEHIIAAEKLARAIGSKSQVRVKVDTIGVGWGVVGMLKEWGKAGKHGAVIVAVNVAERPEEDDESAEMRPNRKRDEMWLGGRFLLQPDPKTGEGRIRIRIVDNAAADKNRGNAATQLSVPNFGNNSGGLIVVESKASMKKRGRPSPDRAEALLLAFYEPEPVRTKPRRGIIAGA
jgi:hypothetical protein